MTATRPALTFSLLVATAMCLIAIKAEEQPIVKEVENRQAKQIYLTPQYYPASTQFYYADGSRYENAYPSPYVVPSAEHLVGASQDASFPHGYPMLAFDNNGHADWRRIGTGGHGDNGVKWSRRSANRMANINILPAATECLNSNTQTDGLRPCVVATQAEQGFIDILFSEAEQTAIVGITADSQKHTRVKLICTEITDGAGVFTQSGQIIAVTNTPRTEVGYMQLVATSAAADDVVRCSWISYHHYVGQYP